MAISVHAPRTQDDAEGRSANRGYPVDFLSRANRTYRPRSYLVYNRLCPTTDKIPFPPIPEAICSLFEPDDPLDPHVHPDLSPMLRLRAPCARSSRILTARSFAPRCEQMRATYIFYKYACLFAAHQHFYFHFALRPLHATPVSSAWNAWITRRVLLQNITGEYKWDTSDNYPVFLDK